MEAICIVCKKPFLKKANRQMICSEECRKEHNSNKYKKQWVTRRIKFKNNPKRKEKELEQRRKWRKVNKEKIREQKRKWSKVNKEKIRKKANEWRTKRKKIDPIYKLSEQLRIQLNYHLKQRKIVKKSRALELLGVKVKYFKKYIEHKFKPGMTWENQGKVWHIDHIIPLACLDLTREDILKFAFHYRNMQPMFAYDNQKKGANIFIPVEKWMKLRDVDKLVLNVLEKCRPDYEFDFQIKKDGVLLKYIKN